jgi:hypothetical protein
LEDGLDRRYVELSLSFLYHGLFERVVTRKIGRATLETKNLEPPREGSKSDDRWRIGIHV